MITMPIENIAIFLYSNSNHIYSTYIGKLSLNFGIDDSSANKPFNAMFLSLSCTHIECLSGKG
jgi:hypothetical protein